MNRKEIYLAGGCFWGMQAYFNKIKGSLNTEVGYLNGTTKATTYEQVSAGSGHVEALKLSYDQDILSDQEVFNLFMRVIDPYSVNKQGGDIGIQYRTGIYSSDKNILNSYQNILLNWESINKKSSLEIKVVNNYCKAEMNHQEYLLKNPTGYCHINLYNIPDEYMK